MRTGLKILARRLGRSGFYRALVRWTRRPGVGRVDFGDLRRLRPISSTWGSDRGQPIDRAYIDRFLADHRGDVAGRVLEVGGDLYSRRFGAKRVTAIDVLHLDGDQPGVTVVADLTDAPQIESDRYDGVLCIQTLQFIPDVAAAVATLHRIVRPGGVVLATVPTISRLDFCERNRADDCWRITRRAARWLFEASFGAGAVEVTAYGNVLSATAFLHGIAAEELSEAELDPFDPAYEMLVGVRAVKAAGR